MSEAWRLPMKESDMNDFLGLTPDPGFTPPRLKNIGQPSSIPEDEVLFAVQNNILRAMQSLNDLEQSNPDIHWAGLQHHLRQSYKSLNRWLREHA